MTNDVRKLINNLQHPDKKQIASILATRGYDFDLELGEHTQTNIEKHHANHPFIIAITQSLVWAEYLTEKDITFRLMHDFLVEDADITGSIAEVLWRREKEKVMETLQSWKLILSRTRLENLPVNFTANELLQFQNNLVDKTLLLFQTKQLKGMGSWILFAPFKVLAAFRDDLWKDDTLNNVLFPLGAQVVNGLHFINSKVGLKGLGDLSENERDLSIDIATTTLAQKNIEADLANLGETDILHINSGLFLAGSKV